MIVDFTVVIPDDYSLSGFRQRNPDKFYKIHEAIIDRHFQRSQKLNAGDSLTANICELRGAWKIKQCLEFITEKRGYLPSAVGLTLALEQGERYLTQKL